MLGKVTIAYGEPEQVQLEMQLLQEAGCEVVLAGQMTANQMLSVAGDADALMVGLNVVNEALLAQLSRCQIIARVGTGTDAIDIPAATARGIWVTNVPDYAVDEVSTHAISLALALTRSLLHHRDLVRSGHWRYRPLTPIRRLAGQTLGILGLGRIGSASARKGIGLGMRVIACDPYLPEARFSELGVRRVEYETLLRESDILTLHVPLTPETRRIIDARALSLMKPTAYLINTARGDVVDIEALYEAVRRGRIAGAGLDVLPWEPPSPDHPVLHEERILVTPHIAWASEEAARDSRIRACQDVIRVLHGERPVYPLNDVPLRRNALELAN
jgi:D-3-phosphoglycerate dehydrogenase